MLTRRNQAPVSLPLTGLLTSRVGSSACLFLLPGAALVGEESSLFGGQASDTLGGNLVQHPIDLTLRGVLAIPAGLGGFPMARHLGGRVNQDPGFAPLFLRGARAAFQKRRTLEVEETEQEPAEVREVGHAV